MPHRAARSLLTVMAITTSSIARQRDTPTNAAHRGGGSPYDGDRDLECGIYTLRGRFRTRGSADRRRRVYFEDQSFRASGGVGVVRVAVSGFGRSGRMLGHLVSLATRRLLLRVPYFQPVFLRRPLRS